jgi:rare lipoprotein A (peptidoglycan hydrolase)
LSYAAARCLGSVQVGVIPYEATILTPDDSQAWEEAALPL